ncbi:MAG: S1/P1 Nuclease [Flammeovirgaceae bacterium]|nr:S1/P1 Nuclease [Flammeovirgaceae bacterium]MBE62973.1 S1/P1 Nuclease [Flammeovirgaceae bacterium]MBR06982.1 S1/P1 Nuclease [Rickettsiales bacterium]HCX22387.1 S1/P1 Nuclease [Cytophagales bacterium]|tara:strand:- start:4496 stop:5260 length:765 start_codon:yes stop_codon:yes gene_type:complete
MKRIIALSLLMVMSIQALPWGKTGHRVIGLIAEKHLSKKAKKQVDKILKDETVAEVANYMDFIRSDKTYKHMDPWHYCTLPDGKTYAEAGTPEEGDAIVAIEKFTEELKTKQFTEGDEAFTLKLLIHLIGDIHQPLHVGNGEDKGGNDVKLEYFWQSSNLHRVWDSGMIDGQQYAYTEYVEWINHASEDQIAQWQSDDLMVWINESKEYRNQCYDLPESMKINYRYDYDNIDLVNLRLLQAGIRLAAVLNEIYG